MGSAAQAMLLGEARNLVRTLIPQASGTIIDLNLAGRAATSTMFDGTTSVASGAGTVGNTTATAGYNYAIGKNWGAGVNHVVTQYKVWAPNNNGVYGVGATTTDCKLQGSDDGSAWTDLQSPTLSVLGSANDVLTVNTGLTLSAWQYHRVAFNNNGVNSYQGFVEMQFWEDI